MGTLFALVGPLINLLDTSVPEAFRRSLRLVWPHFMLVFCFISLPLAVEHEVVVLVAELIPHEHIWAVFLTTFILGDLFGMALGLMEVTLAERLVSGAQGPGADLLSATWICESRAPHRHGQSRHGPSVSAHASSVLDSPRPTNHEAAPSTRPPTATDRPPHSHPRRPTMEETIHGTTMPVLELSLADGESIVSEAGEFSWMSDAVQMATNTGGGMGGKGIMGAVKRPSPAPAS